MSHIEGVIPWIGRRTIDKNASYDFKVMVWERESAWMSQWERERVGSDIGVPFPLQQRVIFSSGATWTSVPRLKADSILCVSYRGRIVRGREDLVNVCAGSVENMVSSARWSRGKLCPDLSRVVCYWRWLCLQRWARCCPTRSAYIKPSLSRNTLCQVNRDTGLCHAEFKLFVCAHRFPSHLH